MLDVDKTTGKINSVKFVRIKLNLNKDTRPYPRLMLEFELIHYPGHWCRVWKRRRHDPDNKKVVIKDWMIEVD